MIRQRKIELLAPAKNLECGIAAIDHGADAVYIGAPRFGARAAAGNSIEDLTELVKYAHLYNPKKQNVVQERTLQLKKIISDALKSNVKEQPARKE